MLTDTEMAFYRDNGFLVVEGVLDPDKLARLRRVTDDVVAGANGLSTSTANLELGDDHTPGRPGSAASIIRTTCTRSTAS